MLNIKEQEQVVLCRVLSPKMDKCWSLKEMLIFLFVNTIRELPQKTFSQSSNKLRLGELWITWLKDDLC